MQKFVIIGNSAAAVGAVEGIRSLDTTSPIVIISDEAYHTYSRPLISYLLLGKTDEKKMRYRGADFYAKNKCEFINSSVTKIDDKAKAVILADGKSVKYDKLLVSTGSSAFVPPFEGLETVEKKFTFMKLDDAKSLGKALDKKANVLIVGAGLIGLKCAEGILAKCASVTVIDLAPRILSSILDDEGAHLVQKHLEKQGVKFLLGNTVSKFTKNTALLKDGKTLSFDILVLAVGVKPNTSLLDGIAKIEKGIVVDAKSKTTATDIYSAGDCTLSVDASSGQKKILALLPNAYIQGETAGINMAGGEASFDNALPMNAIGFFGLHMITAGTYSGDVYKGKGDTYKRMYYADNKLNGFIIIGDVEKAGIYTSLIREKTPLDTIDFSLICEKPGLIAFAKEDRKQKLGAAK